MAKVSLQELGKLVVHVFLPENLEVMAKVGQQVLPKLDKHVERARTI